MASGKQESENLIGYRGSDQNNEEVGSVQECLKRAMTKNQDLENMLLYTTQELEKEKENSRKIVQTLTERLMESRETINKLEAENMRYKKDCSLATKLLQCNRSVTQGHVTTTVKTLSEYDESVPRESSDPTVGSPLAMKEQDCRNNRRKTKEDATHLEASKPRTRNKKKPDITHEDTTALLDKEDTNERNVKHGRYQKIMKTDLPLEYQKDTIKTTSEKSCQNENEYFTEEDKLFIVNETQELKQNFGRQGSNDAMTPAQTVKFCQPDTNKRSDYAKNTTSISTGDVDETMEENKELSQTEIDQDVEDSENYKLLSCNEESRIDNSDSPEEYLNLRMVTPKFASFDINDKTIEEECKGAEVVVSVGDDPTIKDNEDMEDTPLV